MVRSIINIRMVILFKRCWMLIWIKSNKII